VRVGAHLPTRGGILSVLDAAEATGADAVQTFASNPRAWRWPDIDRGVARDFRSRLAESGRGPVFLHAPYLVNIATPNGEFYRRSVDLARATMTAAEAIGARGLVVHAGAGGRSEPEHARARAAAALLQILAEASTANVVVELTAGGAGSVAARIPEASRLFEAAGRPEGLRLCLDSCHLFAAGYELDGERGAHTVEDELRSARLVRRLVLVHANDARFPRGSRRDRHEHIGEGYIGREGFRRLLARPILRRCAVLCETPGTLDDHRRNIATLRELAA
jgi:deoxyribonuclease IV